MRPARGLLTLLAACAAAALLQPALAQTAPQGIEGLPAQAPKVEPAEVVHLPATVPQGDSSLLTVPLPGSPQLHFMVDPASVRRIGDSLVRYTLVAVSRSGFRNVSYEGLNCANDTWHVYATWRAGKQRWVPNTDPNWLHVNVQSSFDVHGVLDRNYWCAATFTAGDAKRLVERLRQGVHQGFVQP